MKMLVAALILFSVEAYAQVELDPDTYGRTVMFANIANSGNDCRLAFTCDVYHVVGSGTDITLKFPAGKDRDDVYETINSMAPGP